MRTILGISLLTDAPDALSWLTRKLNRIGSLDEEDRARLAALPVRLEQVPRFHRLIREGERPEQCCLLVEGVASRYKGLASGERQIVSFHIRGDLLDIQHLLLSRADHSIETITSGWVAWIPKPELLALAWERPTIGKALWRDCLIDASIFREWVLNIGRRDAKQRVAHMLCELVARSHAAGLGQPEALTIPLTQYHIAEATGLTAVHVNRMIQELRADGALARIPKQIIVSDWPLFQKLAGFDAAYLHEAA